MSAPDRDQRLLLVSVWASVGFAVLSSVWGVLSGSTMIVFDGLYSFASIGFSLLAVQALRVSRRGADERYPWGREAWEPFVVLVKAVALAGLCLYAIVGGVLDIVHGGRAVATGAALVYGFVASLAGFAVTVVMRHGGRHGSGLVRAEAAEWLGDSLLSLGVLAGFGVAFALVRVGREDLAAYVDPAMVVAVSALFLVVPARLVVGGLRELLSMAPPPAMRDRLAGCVDAVREEYGFAESFLRASKVGSRVDVEIDFVLGDSPVRTVADCDRVREDLHERLSGLGFEPWVTVAFTHDRRWAV